MNCSRLFLTTAATVSIFSTSVFAAPAEGVNWSQNVITVVGTGFATSDIQIPTQAKKLAERAALADAYRQLAEIVKGVNVTGETTVEAMMVRSDIINTKVNAVIKGARKISTRETGDGGVEVVVEMPIFGSANSLASSVLQKPTKKEPFPNPVRNVAPTKPAYTAQTPIQQRIDVTIQSSTSVTLQAKSSPIISNILDPQTKIFFTPEVELMPLSKITISKLPKIDTPQVEVPVTPQISNPATPQVQQPATSKIQQPEQNLSSDSEIIGGYTGIIVDCRGMNLQSVMSPVIKNENKDTIYGDKNLDYDKVIEFGMATYSDGVENLSRAGKNPIVVKAVNLDNFNSNPVLTVADSNRVLLENKSTGFLDKMNVVFLQ